MRTGGAEDGSWRQHKYFLSESCHVSDVDVCRYYESLETVGIKLHSKFTESCGSGVAGARHRGHQSSDGAPGADSVSTLADGRGAQGQ